MIISDLRDSCVTSTFHSYYSVFVTLTNHVFRVKRPSVANSLIVGNQPTLHGSSYLVLMAGMSESNNERR